MSDADPPRAPMCLKSKVACVFAPGHAPSFAARISRWRRLGMTGPVCARRPLDELHRSEQAQLRYCTHDSDCTHDKEQLRAKSRSLGTFTVGGDTRPNLGERFG